MSRPASSVVALTTTRPGDGLAQLLNGGLLPCGPAPAPGPLRPGLDFASRNALGLTLRSASNGMDPSASAHVALEHRIAAELRLPHALSFTSGAEAIRHTLATLLRPEDHVLVDAAAGSAMFETVLAVRATLHRYPSGSLDAVERRLNRLSRHPRRGRLVIALPAVSALGSRISDLAGLSSLARQHAALLVVDVSQDFGAMGQKGGGVLELQACLDRVDVVLGSLSRCFGIQGGFAAFRDPALCQAAARAPRLAPAQATAALAAADIVFSPDGTSLRRNLMGLSLRLRNHLMADGARVTGSASPFVPVLLPALTALPRTALLESAGPRVTLLMPPTVPMQAPRWRIELNARHSMAEIDDLAELMRDVARAFDRQPTRARVPA
ncbi:aminotransferase class I/II-fold pyridoxal phosphate-dependent enzyme [Rhodobacter sp. SY28-1]|uniref:aminotransferase class I/II-fold pyridoxal phosphate-dependent enzyme n=1 Tax=Rhodobacter sp. SY28-1 TaxID=2562317 RepID=UPI0010C0A12F|nr:aminotransferase class I/II-fold pyridoxal phosphate-dependent enzyme [Rhodobacter sp. SY28-1]